jgi:kynurenine 3-monooxygenase
MRLPSSQAAAQQRSINLAVSSRGIAAMQAIDPVAASSFLDNVIPMRGRMIHNSSGNLEGQPYDRNGQVGRIFPLIHRPRVLTLVPRLSHALNFLVLEKCINSIDRALLNRELLEGALAVRSIRAFFHHKVVSIDFDGRVMSVLDVSTGEQLERSFDLCIGADGSFSIVRRQLMRVVRWVPLLLRSALCSELKPLVPRSMDYQQEYIPHEYLELKIPPGQDSHNNPTFLLDPNHLHIWPRHSFMLIALPNKVSHRLPQHVRVHYLQPVPRLIQDKSFTCTLFAPTTEFETLSNKDQILSWFRIHFPDTLELIGTEVLLNSFQQNPRNPLISIKVWQLSFSLTPVEYMFCPQTKPYHYKDRAIILGDAAHSMVPFYGQGLNCGLEDVRVLTALLHEAGVDPTRVRDPDDFDLRLAGALTRYSESRHEDLIAISDLAMDN